MGIIKPLGRTLRAFLIQIGTKGTEGHSCAKRNTPLLNGCNARSSFILRVPSGKMMRECVCSASLICASASSGSLRRLISTMLNTFLARNLRTGPLSQYSAAATGRTRFLTRYGSETKISKKSPWLAWLA